MISFFCKSRRSALPGFPPVNNIIKDPTFQSLMTQSILFSKDFVEHSFYVKRKEVSRWREWSLSLHGVFTVHCTLNTEHGGAEHCPGTRDMVEVGILNSKLQSGKTTCFVVLHHWDQVSVSIWHRARPGYFFRYFIDQVEIWEDMILKIFSWDLRRYYTLQFLSLRHRNCALEGKKNCLIYLVYICIVCISCLYVNLVQIIEALWDDVEVSSLPGDPLGLEAGIIKFKNNVHFEGKKLWYYSLPFFIIISTFFLWSKTQCCY